MFPLTLAAGASMAWGASDFLGGLAARRLPVVVVLFGAQAVGLLLAAAAWSVAGAHVPAGDVLLLGGAAGIAELLGFACLYRGLAVGEMTAVAPLAALTAVLPVAVAVGGGAEVAAIEAVGMLLAIIGTAVTATESGARRVVRGAGLGLGAALCFGTFFVFLGEASESSGAAAVLSGRVASVTVLALLVAVRPPGVRPTRRDAGVIAARGLLHEHLGAPRLAGVVAVLGGVALISASAEA
jgi:drug/metabolite transporter (DMT)-like permease